jgi:hypothetical protein
MPIHASPKDLGSTAGWRSAALQDHREIASVSVLVPDGQPRVCQETCQKQIGRLMFDSGSIPSAIHVGDATGHFRATRGQVDRGNNQWRLPFLRRKTSMFFRPQVICGVRQLVERQYLAAASAQAKHEYGRLPSVKRQSTVKSFLQERTGGSSQGAKTLLRLL